MYYYMAFCHLSQLYISYVLYLTKSLDPFLFAQSYKAVYYISDVFDIQ